MILSELQLERIVYAATLAPSPHNAQGWKFHVRGDELEVRRDTSRKLLAELDPHEKEGMIAIGAAVENLTIAARHEGFDTEVQWLQYRPDGLSARIRFSLREMAMDDELYDWIGRRSINRSLYRKKAIAPRILDELRQLAERDGLELYIVTAPERIRAFAELAGQAGLLKFRHEPTHRELYRFLRFTPQEAASFRDGLPLERFGISASLARWGRLGMRWGSLQALRLLGVDRMLAYSQETRPIQSAPAVCMLVSRAGGSADYLRGGRTFQRIALTCARRGLAMQPHSAAADWSYACLSGYHRSVSAEIRRQTDTFTERLGNIFAANGPLHVVNLFRIGYAERELPRSSLRRNLRYVLEQGNSLSHPEPIVQAVEYKELTCRNYPFISLKEQQKLRNARIGVAGCGSIGGAPVELLARMGAENFLLAEPDSYERNNLNRQNATLHDMGKNKAESLLERIRQINLRAKGIVLSEGVTSANVQYFVGTSEVVIDGIDITDRKALAAKVLLHLEAWRQQRPVICGYDIAGTQLFRLYDYRSGALRPLEGKFDRVDTEQLTPLQFLSRVISPLDLPLEMLPVTESMILGRQGSIPQLGPTASLFGVLASWAIVDLLAGRPVRRKVLVDIPELLRPTGRSAILTIRRVWGIVKLKNLLNRKAGTRKAARS